MEAIEGDFDGFLLLDAGSYSWVDERGVRASYAMCREPTYDPKFGTRYYYMLPNVVQFDEFSNRDRYKSITCKLVTQVHTDWDTVLNH